MRVAIFLAILLALAAANVAIFRDVSHDLPHDAAVLVVGACEGVLGWLAWPVAGELAAPWGRR